MTQKKLYIIALSAITIIAAAAVFVITFGLGAKNAARGLLASETEKIQSETETLSADNENIRAEIASIDTELSTKETVNGYYMEYKKTHDSLTQEISDLQNRLDNINSDGTDENRESSAKETVKGRVYTLTGNGSYFCPDKIPAGRYTAKGSGSLAVINSAGKTRISQNLSVAYDNSYTFDIYEKEKIQISDNITLTELKQK